MHAKPNSKHLSANKLQTIVFLRWFSVIQTKKVAKFDNPFE